MADLQGVAYIKVTDLLDAKADRIFQQPEHLPAKCEVWENEDRSITIVVGA